MLARRRRRQSRVCHEREQRIPEISHVVDPARIAVSDMQVALALEAAGTRGFLLTGEEHYAASHRTARENRRRAYARLRELSPSLDPVQWFHDHANGAAFHAADERLGRFYAGRMSRQEYMSHLRDQYRHFVEITADTTLLHQEIRGVAAAKRNEPSPGRGDHRRECRRTRIDVHAVAPLESRRTAIAV